MTTNKPEVVAWLHSVRQDSDVITDKVRHVWGTPRGSMGEYTEPLIRLSDYEALQAECEKLRKDAETEQAIQRAAEVLPPGCRIEIEVEKDAGTVSLFGPGPSVSCDFQGSFAEQINDAIDAAMQGGDA